MFTPARIAVLKLLASQAAIALENARLYSDVAEREAKIRRLIDANIIGIVIWDFEGRVIEANDAFLRIVGYDREDLISGRIRWTELTPPEWRDRDVRRWLPDLKMTGSLQPFEKEYFRKDRSRVPVLIGTATFEEGGDQGVAFVLDLTARVDRECVWFRPGESKSARRAGITLLTLALPARGEARQIAPIVANETADPRTSDQARSTDGWHFSGDAVRFLQGGERPRGRGPRKAWLKGSPTPELTDGVAFAERRVLGRRLSGLVGGRRTRVLPRVAPGG
jgi:PAS domain S-box-containing protein